MGGFQAAGARSSGRGPPGIDGPALQLSGLSQMRGDSGVRRLQGAARHRGGEPLSQHPRRLHKGGGDSRRLYREGDV